MDAEEVEELRRLIAAASSCIGPCSRARAVRSSDAPGARTFLTSSCSTVLKAWPVERSQHVLRLVLDSTEAHLRQNYDGGWLFLNLCLRVVLTVRGLMKDASSAASCSRAAALHGLALAAQWMGEALDMETFPCRWKLDWSDLKSVMALLRASLCKPVALASPSDAQHLAATLLEAFLQTLSEEAGGVDDGLRFEWFCGPEVSWSSAQPGLLLDTPAIVPSADRRRQRSLGARDLHLVLFDASLEQWLPGEADAADAAQLGMERFTVETLLSDATGIEAGSLRRWELKQFRRLADALLEADVAILACQKLVDPWLADYLSLKGVVVLSRLSIRHIDHVRRLSGASPVTSLAALPKSWTDVLGVVGNVELRNICERSFTVLWPPSGIPPRQTVSALPQMSTLLVGAPDEHALAELKRCVPQALHCLKEVASSGTVLAGAGLTELHLSDVLEDKAGQMLQDAKSSGGSVAACGVVFAVAGCLRDMAACLPADAAVGFQRIGSSAGAAPGPASTSLCLEEARRALSELRSCDGRNAAQRLPGLVLEAELPKRRALQGSNAAQRLPGLVLEAELPKRRALQGSLDLAGVLLRLGGTLDFNVKTLG